MPPDTSEQVTFSSSKIPGDIQKLFDEDKRE